MFTYIIFIILGGVVGYFVPKYTRINVPFPMNVIVGAVGGFIGGLVLSFFSTVLGIILPLIGVLVGSFVALWFWKNLPKFGN